MFVHSFFITHTHTYIYLNTHKQAYTHSPVLAHTRKRAHINRERECFYCIIVQTCNVGLHSRRHPMKFDAGTRPFASFDAPTHENAQAKRMQSALLLKRCFASLPPDTCHHQQRNQCMCLYIHATKRQYAMRDDWNSSSLIQSNRTVLLL